MTGRPALHSPTNGTPLTQDTPHSLRCEKGERWPVADGIPYLRTGREELVAEVLALLDDNRQQAALILLLADQDPWWTGPVADPINLETLVDQRDTLTLREAMRLLGFGPVADYFAHRWTDPTYLAGLALLDAHWQSPRTAFELAGGIGHYARLLGQHGVAVTSADIVFAKNWLGKHWVAPDAQYLTFDAASPWPIADQRFDLVHCQDAFYFLREQSVIADRMRDCIAEVGQLCIGHLHNGDVAGGPWGPARTAAEWKELFPAALVYDEAELRRALLHAGVPSPCALTANPSIEAWSLIEPATPAKAADGPLSLTPAGERLVPNPLLTDGDPAWPSDRYRQEYGKTATWLDPDASTPPERDRRLVALPERW